jgi:hypothetical protein
VDEGDRRGVDRLTIQEAARALGISEGAVRKRVARGTLRHEKEQDGRIYVYLDAGARRRVDGGQDEGVDPNNNALISQFRDEVSYLRDENRRKDEIIMQQAMTVRQLTSAPAQEATEVPTASQDDQARDETKATNTSEATTPLQRDSGFLPPLKDKLPLRDYALAVAVPLAWLAFASLIEWLLVGRVGRVSVTNTRVEEALEFVLGLVPWNVLLLLSGFWLGVRRRGGLPKITLSFIGAPFAIGLVFERIITDIWLPGPPDLLDMLLDAISVYLLVVAGALLGQAIQSRGLKTGIYGDDPAASAPHLQSRRAVSNLIIGSGAATIIAALINSIALVIDR